VVDAAKAGTTVPRFVAGRAGARAAVTARAAALAAPRHQLAVAHPRRAVRGAVARRRASAVRRARDVVLVVGAAVAFGYGCGGGRRRSVRRRLTS
jgi:hypothetical protein